jgi:site-specific DNA-methyltransferase (adenine-specific)
MTVSLVPLEQLTPAPWNPRHIDKARLKNLAESIKADPNFLLRRPILAQTSGEIYAGNQRWHAAKLLFSQGWTPPWNTQTVPADLDDVPDQLARERALRDNNAWGAWDDDSLARLLGDLRDAGSDTGLLGFDDRELSQLLARLGDGKELNPDDADLTPPADPITKPGDLWILGDHRLLCGDAFLESDHDVVLDGDDVDYVLTDPPYGVGLDYDMPEADDERLVQRVIDETMPLVLRWPIVTITTGARWLWCYPQPTWMLIWIHPAGMGLGPWGFTTVNPALVYGADPYLANGLGSRADSVVLNCDREGVEGHPVPKPLAVWEWFLERGTTKHGQIVFDPFVGSGTTIIAAEKLARRCRAIEISPAYCDVICRRWERVSGQKAVLQRGR